VTTTGDGIAIGTTIAIATKLTLASTGTRTPGAAEGLLALRLERLAVTSSRRQNSETIRLTVLNGDNGTVTSSTNQSIPACSGPLVGGERSAPASC
jgi:hypothetical protein